MQAQLSDRRATAPVVIIASDDTPEARARAVSLSAEAYLCTPIDISAFLRRSTQLRMTLAAAWIAVIAPRSDRRRGCDRVISTAPHTT